MSILGPQSEDVRGEADQTVDRPERNFPRKRDETHILGQTQDIKSTENANKEAAQILAIKVGLGLPDALKQKFLEPFSDEEKPTLIRVFKENMDNLEGGLLFDKNIGGNVNFVAYKGESRFGGEIFFRVMDGEEIKAQINFRPGKENVLDMVHREVQSQTLGISGSSLLVKIDEYCSYCSN